MVHHPSILIFGVMLIGISLFYHTQLHHHITTGAHAWSAWGNQVFGLDITAPRQNIFSLLHDLSHPVRITDHGVVHRSRLMGISNFLSRGEVRTVADALAWFDIPVTAAQARSIGLCRPLDTLSPDEEIVIQPDPWQRGIASWYGPGFHGRLAASGEIYNMYDRTAAHKSLPLQSLVRVVSQKTGQSTIVRINDRGPYIAGRIIDLSHRSKELLGMQGGLAGVYIERLDPSFSHTDCP
jgi:rare lipoprotein A (RlpA)-like double-psi beta-barrel protein